MRFSWLAAAALSLTFAPKLAAQAPQQLTHYEEESVDIALESIGGGKVDRQPEGKVIEEVVVVTLDVTSQQSVIRAEVLLHPGQVYSQALVDESARNLRLLPQLSVVVIVSLQGTESGRVKLLVVTKDVWSLRLAYEPIVEDGRLTYLSVHPSETNILGTHQTLAANIVLTPTNYSLGGTYVYPRIGGSRINAYVSANALINCHTNELDGANGYFGYGQPLYSSFAKWSWQVAGTWSSQIYTGEGLDADGNRRAVCGDGSVHRAYAPVAGTQKREPTEDPAEFRVTRREVLLPMASRSESLRGQAVLTRSFFQANKLNLSTGAELEQFRSSPVDAELGEVNRRSATYWVDSSNRFIAEPQFEPLNPDREDYLAARSRPAGRRRISPYVQLHAFANRWHRLVNYDSLGFQEDWPMGHDVYLRLYPSFAPLSSHDAFGMFSSAAYAWPIGNGFAKVLVGSRLELGRLREGRAAGAPRVTTLDAHHQVALHWASPTFGVGRLVADASASYRPITTFFGYGATGGTGRLRGYNLGEFAGPGVVDTNLEFRSTPVHFFSVNAGGVLFFDAGGAFRGIEREAGYKGAGVARHFELMDSGHAAGVGVRLLAPQLDRDVFRIDVGFPLRADRLGEVRFIATFRQAFLPPYAPPPVLLPQ
ncbi:MAG: hypothetical protein RJA70_1870 [Pseudomonadota bacterium]|jgi:hypothetical protein